MYGFNQDRFFFYHSVSVLKDFESVTSAFEEVQEIVQHSNLNCQ